MGSITDKDTNEPIQFASVYISYSNIGTVTSSNGIFNLENLPRASVELIISYVGYVTVKKTIRPWVTEHVTIQLEKDDYFLNQVEVKTSRDKKWQKNYNRFRKSLLGEDVFGKSCEIMNPWVLEFTNKNNVFEAQSSKLLVINNLSLGYKINYLLEKFISKPNKLEYAGIPTFQELVPQSEAQKQYWIKNREIAYSGSFQHYLKTVIDNKSDSSNFESYFSSTNALDENGKEIRGKDLIFKKIFSEDIFYQKPLTKVLRFKKFIKINYSEELVNGNIQESWVKLNQQTFVDNLGNLKDPNAVTFYGHLAKERVGYLLPREFRSKAKRVPSKSF